MRVRMSPGSTRIGRHVLLAQLGRKRARQQLEGGFGRAVRPPSGIGGCRRVTGDVDDEPLALDEQRQRQLHQAHRRADVHGKDSSETRDVERFERSDSAQLRRVVDEHVQTAQLPRRVDQSRAYWGRCNVTVHREDGRCVTRQFVGGDGESVAIAATDHEAVSAPRQDAGNHQSQASAGTSHESDASVFSHQRSLPSKVPSLVKDRTSSALEVKQEMPETSGCE